MQYKVHRVEVDKKNMVEKLERFLNDLTGEVVAVFPNVKPNLLLLGATAKVYSVLVVENIG
jgi:hypothetical protein